MDAMDSLDYLMFSCLFIAIHTASYLLAGVLALRISGDLYEERNRVLDFLRDMSDPEESGHVSRYFIPAQLLRGLLMSVVLYPILGPLGELSYPLQFAFFAGLMFVFTDFACAVPFPNNIEGLVYMKRRYLKRKFFWKLYLETAIYSVLFGLLAGLIIS